MKESLGIIVQILFAAIIVFDIIKIVTLRTEKKWMEKLFEKDRDHYHYRIRQLEEELRQINEENE